MSTLAGRGFRGTAILFRVDASVEMGAGHVMRCLALANLLKLEGANCVFLCRDHPGNLVAEIRQHGYLVHLLPCKTVADRSAEDPVHVAWLGGEWCDDMEQTALLLKELHAAYLIVDHYALDWRWEAPLRRRARVLVIDDLADRAHDCDLLLDQNLGRRSDDYASLVPNQCHLMIGPQYALLRSEFLKLREYSLARRKAGALCNVLVAMGGMDSANVTQIVLEAMQESPLPRGCRIIVVLGSRAPWLHQVRDVAAHMSMETHVEVSPPAMAQLMADADLAIGGAGGMAWERCCLGVPALVVALAQNQRLGAKALAMSRAALLLGEPAEIPTNLPSALAAATRPEFLVQMSRQASTIVDGRGVERAVRAMGAALE